jgi:hypothetical protein
MRRFPFLPGLLLLSALVFVGCRSTTIEYPHLPTVFLEAGNTFPGQTNPVVTLPVSRTEFRIFDKPLYDPTDIIRIEMVRVDRGLAVRYLLTPSASRDLMRTSVDNIGYRLVFFDNNDPIGARMIDGSIENGMIYTFLEVPDEEVPELVTEMNRTLVEFRRKNPQ